MSKHKILTWLILLLFAIGLSACGGGGGGSSSDTTNNWDEMKWDQGQWK